MKIAIISCYDEGEANSEYTKALEAELITMGHNVEILRLPFAIFGSTSSAGRKKADILIRQYAARLSDFDYVNIHYEYLLFGRKGKDVLSHVLTLIRACKNHCFSVIFHNFPDRKIISPFKLKIVKYYKKLTELLVAQIIFHELEKKQGMAIVHTFRHKRFINTCCKNLDVIVMPLRYERNEKLRTLVQQFSRSDFMSENGISLSQDIKVISIVGTLHPYKDYESVIKAIQLLPDNYHLFIWGGMHKLSFALASSGLPYIADAQKLICKLKLSNRVHFMGYQETSQDFQRACMFSDYIVIPYTEIGESASAAAYTALEFCKHVFVTRNNCFEELNMFCHNMRPVFQYDMGNYMELAEKIRSLPYENRILNSREYFLNNYSITENAKKIIGV